MRTILFLLPGLLLAGCAGPGPDPVKTPESDATFTRLADDFIGGYLAWRPQMGTSLGLHQYDGKVTDLSRPSLDAELARLKSFDQQLADMNVAQLSAQSACDYRILRNVIQHEVFGFEEWRGYAINPMTYIGAVD